MKIINKIIGAILKVLLKVYKPEVEGKPIAISTDVGQVLREIKKEGGAESWIPGHPFPFPGLPDNVVIDVLNFYKRFYPLLNKWGWVMMRDKLPNYLRKQSQDGDIGLVNPMVYSKPVKEMHRVYTLMRQKEGEPEMKGKMTEKRDMECMFYEFDDTYRFREMERMLMLDREQFKFNEADRYWSDKKWKYDWEWKKNKEFWAKE